jgi:SAM-dependent methyltransferase
MSGQDLERIRASYDAVTDRYVEQIHDELTRKPLDRALLRSFAEEVLAGHGPAATVADIGCGPGHVTGFLSGCGLHAIGIDLSPMMVSRARDLHPELTFSTGTMTALDAPDGTWAGAVAFYSIIHLTTDADVNRALTEVHRVLAPGGRLLIAVHLGPEGDVVIHADEMLGVDVDMDFRLFDLARLEHAVAAAGFAIRAKTVREPYDGAEVATTRAYVLSQRA